MTQWPQCCTSMRTSLWVPRKRQVWWHTSVTPDRDRQISKACWIPSLAEATSLRLSEMEVRRGGRDRNRQRESQRHTES